MQRQRLLRTALQCWARSYATSHGSSWAVVGESGTAHQASFACSCCMHIIVMSMCYCSNRVCIYAVVADFTARRLWAAARVVVARCSKRPRRLAHLLPSTPLHSCSRCWWCRSRCHRFCCCQSSEYLLDIFPQVAVSSANPGRSFRRTRSSTLLVLIYNTHARDLAKLDALFLTPTAFGLASPSPTLSSPNPTRPHSLTPANLLHSHPHPPNPPGGAPRRRPVCRNSRQRPQAAGMVAGRLRRLGVFDGGAGRRHPTHPLGPVHD